MLRISDTKEKKNDTTTSNILLKNDKESSNKVVEVKIAESEWLNDERIGGGDLKKRSVSGHGKRDSAADGHAFAFSSTLIEDYADWEADDYLEDSFFDPRVEPMLLKDDGCILYLIYVAEKLTTALFWILFKPILLFISRRVSGIKYRDSLSKKKNVGGNFGVDTYYKPHGYYGWGKIIMINPDKVVDTLIQELTNLSLVAALMLTITLPLVCAPQSSIASKTYSWLYLLVGGGSVAGQFATVTSSLGIITNLNKAKVNGGKSGLLFLKSLFNPYYGLTGMIGPMLYLGAIFSWCSTVIMSIILTISSYEDMGQPNAYWSIYFICMMVPFGAYFFLQLPLGIACEIKCSQVEMRQYFLDSKEYLKTHKQG